jgi:ubiquinone/menaquinone biosynthesis C-methylase UbiE
MARAFETYPRPLPALFGGHGLAAVASAPLLCALRDATPIYDPEMERFLTVARRALLDTAGAMSGSSAGIDFYSALARQCFINEYVFAVTADEVRKADYLRNWLSTALATAAPVPALLVAAVAAYFPLYTLSLSRRLLERSWPEEIARLLTQQVVEPAEERRIAASVPQLTDIDEAAALLVRGQCEEYPCPRWVKLPPSRPADSVEAYLRQTFPLATFDRPSASSTTEILIAGCGTGQQSIRTAQQFPKARLLAVDSSRGNLAYAIRKTRELGISSIEYAQADLLKLGSLDRQFDVIASGGALHHLADPAKAWRTLLPLLRPGGFMSIGLYSGITRQDLARFRDPLFHVREHRLTLAEIDSFLQENRLVFLGFDIAPDVLQSYRLRFPEDRAAANLAQWQVFENEHPETFVGMYQFWLQKR